MQQLEDEEELAYNAASQDHDPSKFLSILYRDDGEFVLIVSSFVAVIPASAKVVGTIAN